jgi:hypothetical protein
MSDSRKWAAEQDEGERISRRLSQLKKATPGEIMTMMDEIHTYMEILQKDDSVSRKIGYSLDKIQRAVATFETMLSKRN